ncbi:MAG: hypothetical protein LQ339_008638 [Xanthoria mediterranea]|nr:MAG: hypothetical protein LQ339_008638 [Xanthoria mediterranea]
MSFAMLFPQRQRQIPLPYHRSLNTQQQQRSAPSSQHQQPQQQHYQPNTPLPAPQSSDRLNGKIYISPLESKLGLHKLLLPVIGEVKRMRWASLPLTAPTTIPSIQHSQVPRDVRGTVHNSDGAGLISLPGVRTRRETEEGQNVLNVDESPAAATSPRPSPPRSESSVVDRVAGESLAASSQHPIYLSAGSVSTSDAGPIVEMGTAASRAWSEEEGAKLHVDEVGKVTEDGEKLGAESPSAAIAPKEVKTESLGSDVQSPRVSAPRCTPGVDAGGSEDCEILSSPPAAFKKAQSMAPQVIRGQAEISVQGQRPLTSAISSRGMAAQPASEGAPTSHQNPTTAPPKVNSPAPAQPTIPPTTVPLPPAATPAPTNNNPSNPPPAQKLTHRELKRIMDALRQRTGDQDLPPALKQRYDFAVRLMREAMITRSSADLPKGLVPIYQSYIDRIMAAEAVEYANTQAPPDGRTQTCRKRVAGESEGGEAEKRRRPSGGSAYPREESSAMPTGPPGRVAPGSSYQPRRAATKTAISMTPEPTGHTQRPQVHPFGHGPNNGQQPEAAPPNALSGYTHIAWRRETENPNHSPYGHEPARMPANRRLWPQRFLGPNVRTLQDEIYEHQVPFIHPRQPDDVYTSEEMERRDSRGSLNIRAESGSPVTAGQFLLSYTVPLKRGAPDSIEAESNRVNRPRKKRATGAAMDPIDLSTEPSAGNINGALAKPTMTKGRKQPTTRRKPATKKAAAGAAIPPTQPLAVTRGAEMESGTPAMGSFAPSILDEPKREGTTDHTAMSTSFTELLENEDDGAWMGMVGFAR